MAVSHLRNSPGEMNVRTFRQPEAGAHAARSALFNAADVDYGKFHGIRGEVLFRLSFSQDGGSSATVQRLTNSG